MDKILDVDRTVENYKDLLKESYQVLPSVNPKPCDDAISRIFQRMWNCRGKHTTSIDKVKMEQIIRDELPSVTQKSETVTEFADRCRECGAKYGKYRKEAKRWKNKWLKSQRSGKWLMTGEFDVFYDLPSYECSKCGQTSLENGDYCPNCGAKMESEVQTYAT